MYIFATYRAFFVDSIYLLWLYDSCEARSPQQTRTNEMTIRISNLKTVKQGTRTEMSRVEYIANSLADCKDSLDAMAYELACEHMDTITIGQVLATPA